MVRFFGSIALILITVGAGLFTLGMAIRFVNESHLQEISNWCFMAGVGTVGMGIALGLIALAFKRQPPERIRGE